MKRAMRRLGTTEGRGGNWRIDSQDSSVAFGRGFSVSQNLFCFARSLEGAKIRLFYLKRSLLLSYLTRILLGEGKVMD